MAHYNNGVDRDDIFSRRFGIAPSLTFGIDSDTQFTALYFHQSEDKRVDFGVPIAQSSDPTALQFPVTEFGVPRSNFFGFLGDTDEVDVDTLTLKFSHKANEWLSLSSDTKLGVIIAHSVRQCRVVVPGQAVASFAATFSSTTIPQPFRWAGQHHADDTIKRQGAFRMFPQHL